MQENDWPDQDHPAPYNTSPSSANAPPSSWQGKKRSIFNAFRSNRKASKTDLRDASSAPMASNPYSSEIDLQATLKDLGTQLASVNVRIQELSQVQSQQNSRRSTQVFQDTEFHSVPILPHDPRLGTYEQLQPLLEHGAESSKVLPQIPERHRAELYHLPTHNEVHAKQFHALEPPTALNTLGNNPYDEASTKQVHNIGYASNANVTGVYSPRDEEVQDKAHMERIRDLERLLDSRAMEVQGLRDRMKAEVKAHTDHTKHLENLVESQAQDSRRLRDRLSSQDELHAEQLRHLEQKVESQAQESIRLRDQLSSQDKERADQVTHYENLMESQAKQSQCLRDQLNSHNEAHEATVRHLEHRTESQARELRSLHDQLKTQCDSFTEQVQNRERLLESKATEIRRLLDLSESQDTAFARRLLNLENLLESRAADIESLHNQLESQDGAYKEQIQELERATGTQAAELQHLRDQLENQDEAYAEQIRDFESIPDSQDRPFIERNQDFEDLSESHNIDMAIALSELQHQLDVQKQHHEQDLKAIREHISCSVCQEDVQQSYVLPDCGHQFCQSCLFDWFQSLSSESYSNDLTCPNCRRRVRARPIEMLCIDNIVHTIHNAQIRDGVQRESGENRRSRAPSGVFEAFF